MGSKKNVKYYILAFILLVVFFVLFFIIEKTAINIISLFGTLLTLLALIITIDQISTIKIISTETKNKVLSYVSITEVGKILLTISDVNNAIKSKNHEALSIKLSDLRSQLVEFSESNGYKEQMQDDKNLINLIDNIVEFNIALSENDIEDFKNGDLKRSLENISIILIKYQSRVKENI